VRVVRSLGSQTVGIIDQSDLYTGTCHITPTYIAMMVQHISIHLPYSLLLEDINPVCLFIKDLYNICPDFHLFDVLKSHIKKHPYNSFIYKRNFIPFTYEVVINILTSIPLRFESNMKSTLYFIQSTDEKVFKNIYCFYPY